jgi:hypothetical protein
MEPLACEHHAGLHQLFVVFPHRGEKFFIGKNARFGLLRGFDNNHESHWCISIGFRDGAVL